MKNLAVIIPMCLLFLASCSSSKNASSDSDYVKIEEFCSGTQYMTDKSAVRASASSSSKDKSLSEQIALDQARTQLATQLKVVVKNVTENYVSQYVVENQEEVGKRYQSMSRQVVNETLTGSVPVCKEVRMSKSTGQYTTWVALELKSDIVLKEIETQIKASDKMKLDFEYEKFKNTFEEELSKR